MTQLKYTITPEVRAHALAAREAWLAYEFYADPLEGFPLKLLPPAFRLSWDAKSWESSWGYNVPLAAVSADEWMQVLDGTAPSCTVGEYTFTPIPSVPGTTPTYMLGCFEITHEQAVDLLNRTPQPLTQGGAI